MPFCKIDHQILPRFSCDTLSYDNFPFCSCVRYNISVSGTIRKVWCDMTTDGGGYTYYPCNGDVTACPSVFQTNVANGCTAIGLSMVIPRSLGHWTRYDTQQ